MGPSPDTAYESEDEAVDIEMENKRIMALEKWKEAVITFPRTVEACPFGQTAPRVFYEMNVNGVPFLSYRYSEVDDLRDDLKKIDAVHLAAAPKLPSSSVFGRVSVKNHDDRRAALTSWFTHIIKSPAVISSDAWLSFTQLEPDYDAVEAEMKLRASALDKHDDTLWTETANKRGVKVCTLKQADSALLIVKTSVKVNVPMTQVFETYNTKAEWSNWDPNLISCKTIELLQGTRETDIPCREIMYAAYRVPVIKNRDVCMYSMRSSGGPGDASASDMCTVMTTSIEHRKCPKVKGFVRGQLFIGLTVFREEDGGKSCMITSVLHMDPRGSIPAALVNSMSAGSLNSIAMMRDYMHQKYGIKVSSV